MDLIILILHLVVCLCLIGLVLLQRSEGGALGMGGGGGSGALMSGRGAADALARMTSVAGGFFLVTSLGLTFLSGAGSSADASGVFDLLPRQERTAPDLTAPPPVDPSDDPTQSSLPEAAPQLASVNTGPAEAAALPAQAPASTRAAPLETRTAASPPPQRQATTPASAPARQPTASAPTQTARQQPASAPTQRPAATQQARTPPRTPPAAPAQGAVSGITLTEEPSPESSQGVQAVRRDQRAGPDQ